MAIDNGNGLLNPKNRDLEYIQYLSKKQKDIHWQNYQYLILFYSTTLSKHCLTNHVHYTQTCPNFPQMPPTVFTKQNCPWTLGKYGVLTNVEKIELLRIGELLPSDSICLLLNCCTAHALTQGRRCRTIWPLSAQRKTTPGWYILEEDECRGFEISQLNQ